ncbi:MAG: hypothetical protein NTZ90_05730 [Proteobacteria bacterium]|nr:hypothetical protein [Pseudomonadota bacterium]
MNEAPSNSTGLNDTFSSQPSPQTNPFTADLKGEFTSNFGTNTNAVSQIFKEGGFVSNNRTKYMIIGGVVIAVLAIGAYFFTSSSDDSSGEDLADGEKAGEESAADDEDASAKPEDKATADAKAKEAASAKAAAATAAAAAPAVPTPKASASTGDAGGGAGSGAVTLGEPADSSSINYDETQGPATFSWTGGGGTLLFSRNSSMHPIARKIHVSGNSYAFSHPWPGTWYWKVKNSSGETEVRSFKVSPAARRNVSLQAPTSGGSVAGNGGTVSWQGDSKVAYYRVELSTGAWANPQFRFSSSGNSLQLQGVAAGQYQMRVGAFSEVAGRWEYTNPQAVTVK